MFGKEEGTEIARAIENLLETDNGNLNELPSLVNRLSGILNLNPENVPRGEIGETERPKILLVGLDKLPLDPAFLDCHCFSTSEASRAWLQENSPDVAAIGSTFDLDLIRELATRNPPIPTVVVMEREDIEERLAIVRAGGRKILVQPVTAGRIQEVVTGLLHERLPESVKVLAVDDDPVILGSLPVFLNPWGIQVTGLENPLDFWETVSIVSPDLLLLDVEMPGVTGIDLCRTVRADPHWQDLPVLFLTASRDPNTIQQIFSIGGDDYLTKPIVGAELLHRVTARLERSRLPRVLATREPITGLTNQPTAEREIDSLIQEGRPLSLAVISIADLDRLRWQYGHGEGNRVLQYWGNFLKSKLFGKEIASYWGNGEFIIVLPDRSKLEAIEFLESILLHFRRQIFTTLSGDRFQIEVRRGVSEYPADGLSVLSLYRAARP
jgi:diguanylate cyclase (GGDEF)-like protein